MTIRVGVAARVALSLLLSPGALCGGCGHGDAGADHDAAAHHGVDPDSAGSDGTGPDSIDPNGGDPNNWVQGYTLIVDFVGGIPADRKVPRLRIDRDLSEFGASQQVFSFGSTHYSHGEIGLALNETVFPEVGKLRPPLEFLLNFGLLKGSAANPVHVDKAGTYPFSCHAPELRITFMTEHYRSTCKDLQGQIEVSTRGDATGDDFRGRFEGRLQRYYDRPDKPDPCDAGEAELLCTRKGSDGTRTRPEIYARVRGWFGFTLPEKEG